MAAQLSFLFSIALALSCQLAHAEHQRVGVVNNNNFGGMNQQQMMQQQMMMNQMGMNGGMGGMGMGMTPQMPDDSKLKEAAAKSIKDGEEVRKKMQESTQKGVEGISKQIGEFSNMIANINKTTADDGSKELLKSIQNAGKSSSDDSATSTAMDMIVNSFKASADLFTKNAQATAAIIAQTKAPEVERKPTSLDTLSAKSQNSSKDNVLADVMSGSSGKDALIPKFGNNPVGYGGKRSSYNSRDNSVASVDTGSSSSSQTAGAQQPGHAAQ